MFQVCTAWEKVQLNDSVKKKLQFNISSIKKKKKKKKKKFFFFFFEISRASSPNLQFFSRQSRGGPCPGYIKPSNIPVAHRIRKLERNPQHQYRDFRHFLTFTSLRARAREFRKKILRQSKGGVHCGHFEPSSSPLSPGVRKLEAKPHRHWMHFCTQFSVK